MQTPSLLPALLTQPFPSSPPSPSPSLTLSRPLGLSMDGQKIGQIKITKVDLCIIMLVVMLYIACGIAACCCIVLHCCTVYCLLHCRILLIALMYMCTASCTAVLAVAQLHCCSVFCCFLAPRCKPVVLFDSLPQRRFNEESTV